MGPKPALIKMRILVDGGEGRGAFIVTAAHLDWPVFAPKQGIGCFARLRLKGQENEFYVDLIDRSAVPRIRGGFGDDIILEEMLWEGWLAIVIVDDGSAQSKAAVNWARALAPAPYAVIAAEFCTSSASVQDTILGLIDELLDDD